MPTTDNEPDRPVRSPISVNASDPAQVAGLAVIAALGVLIAVRQGFRPKIIGG